MILENLAQNGTAYRKSGPRVGPVLGLPHFVFAETAAEDQKVERLSPLRVVAGTSGLEAR